MHVCCSCEIYLKNVVKRVSMFSFNLKLSFFAILCTYVACLELFKFGLINLVCGAQEVPSNINRLAQSLFYRCPRSKHSQPKRDSPIPF